MQIIIGLPEEFRRRAAEIYWEAFKSKLGFALSQDHQATIYFESVIMPQNAIAAISDDGSELLGLAGFDIGEGGIIGGGFREIWKIYGISALWRSLLLAFFIRHTKANTLQMDGIAVVEHARGQGIGGALLEAIFDLARENELISVCLDVIDQNPAARALYERKGFTIVKTESTGWLKYIFGFSKAYKMSKEIDS